eukprot:XP_002529417.2 alpha carbonic anhydrase 7 [Ricinus communis]
MEKPATLFLLFIFLFAFLLHALPTTSKEVGDEKEFSYEKNDEKGPARWGELTEEWKTCSSGSMQSPIDLPINQRVQLASSTEGLNRNYSASDAILKNTGHDIELEWEAGAGTIEINGTEYTLKQLHWHSPSEHTINGRRFALEMHMVHESKDGKIAVIAFLYTIGRPDFFLSHLTDHIRKVAGSEGKETMVGTVDPEDFKIQNIMYYYRYMGSLTTPPCHESVVWTVLKKVRTVSIQQVSLLQEAVDGEPGWNARPTQQTNGRPIHLYVSEDNGHH